jgi:hypothetical protein
VGLPLAGSAGKLIDTTGPACNRQQEIFKWQEGGLTVALYGSARIAVHQHLHADLVQQASADARILGQVAEVKGAALLFVVKHVEGCIAAFR